MNIFLGWASVGFSVGTEQALKAELSIDSDISFSWVG